MNFRPLHDRVLIRRVEPEGKTTGGIIIPDTAQEKPMEGEIVAVGPGARDDTGARRKAPRYSNIQTVKKQESCRRKKYVSAATPAPA